MEGNPTHPSGSGASDRATPSLEDELLRPFLEFQDPKFAWRRLFSELLGTFFLVLVAAGGGMMGQAFPGEVSHTAAVVAPGLMVFAIILFMGKVSGAHLNPAVSIGFAAPRRLPVDPGAGVHPGAAGRRLPSPRGSCRA